MADVQIAVDGQQDVQVALSTISETQIVASLPTLIADKIGDLQDVDVSGIVAGQILQWDGNKWVATWGSREIQATFEAREYAQAYFAAVETADGQALEAGVKEAIVNFIAGCKFDNTWNAIKACCILAGARTLNGALVPLVGAAPTNFNFVSGDYSRTTGLVGDGSTKYLDTNRSQTADPQNNHHLSVYVTTGGTGNLISARANANSALGDSFISAGSASSWPFRSRISAFDTPAQGTRSTQNVTGFTALSRSASGAFTSRLSSTNETITSTSTTPLSGNFGVLARIRTDNGTVDSFGNSRLSFYSIGESLDLALLDARVTQLMTDLAAAIP